MSASIEWDQSLIEKYNYSGPRYTSYPTALEFNESFGMAEFEAAAGRYPERPLSLYVHVPFCHKLCYYCGCNKVITRHQGKADVYLDYLEREVERLAPLFAGRTVTQLHWGGGTPTFLTEPQIRRLNGLLRRHFRFAGRGEFSIEIDPREIELSVLEVLKEEGFNRISLGVQDFDKAVQKVVNREQDNDFIKALVKRAAELGFESTNLDLIYGLPLQTPASFHHTLEQVAAMKPARLSVFNYAHLPSRFAAQRKLNEADMPRPAQKLAMLQDTIGYLTGQGYQFIGMDHFALPDDSLAVAQRRGELHRNFQGYTTQGDCDLLGLGVSAISMIGDAYSQNHKDLKRYYGQLDQLGHAQRVGYALNEDDRLRRDLIKTLICNFELEAAPLEREYGIRFADYFAEDIALLQTFVDDGLVTMEPDAIRVAPKGRLLIRNICMCFDVHLRRQARMQQFSRVI
ncbi:oxygen-independent coproporphyrinogen III oxidase [Zobellella denitrificans]|uniref:oxygen-independent coproporphyrinogen III oxidase n=1 Tax=Zobellella denitrificans TaxID=347534 RepID=UPI000B8C2736|nr:oxygen-independent coproporphyrinogen III oxidase [Zobellella denitrificans]OXS15559.1 oxygen-independent coproporphyrinogen III oxidase [Zobellella denitrificans]